MKFGVCPRANCGAELVYTGQQAGCTNLHVFDVYAYGALREVVNASLASSMVASAGTAGSDVIYVSADQYVTLMDRSARLWNALVNYGNDRFGKFQGKLLDLAIELRDEAKVGRDPGYTTQMDYEVERLKADGWKSYEGRV